MHWSRLCVLYFKISIMFGVMLPLLVRIILCTDIRLLLLEKGIH